MHKPLEDLWQILDEGTSIASSTLLEHLGPDDEGTTDEDEVEGRTMGASAHSKAFANASESFGTSEYAST